MRFAQYAIWDINGLKWRNNSRFGNFFSHVDEQNLNRISFHNVWDNVARVSGHVQKILRSNFSSFSSKNNLTDETTAKTMYG